MSHTLAIIIHSGWLSIRPDHPEITFFEDERKQVLNLEPNKELHMDLRDVGMELRYDELTIHNLLSTFCQSSLGFKVKVRE